MSEHHSDAAEARAPAPAGQSRTSVVAITGQPPEGAMLATVLAELARRDEVVIVCGLPTLRRATESNSLVSLLGAAMPGRRIAVVPVLSCPGLRDADMALIERLRGEQTVVVVAVPVAELVPIAEQLYSRLGADEFALAEESDLGLVMQRVHRSAECERSPDGSGVPDVEDPRPARDSGLPASSPP
jgi:hypothetical protein